MHLGTVPIGEQGPQVIRVTGQDHGTQYRQRLGGDQSVGGITAAGSPEQLTGIPASGGRCRCGAVSRWRNDRLQLSYYWLSSSNFFPTSGG
ncbi:MAG: hypothetical protein ACRDRU_03575 [Pseudonocardiaceae bacterium]